MDAAVPGRLVRADAGQASIETIAAVFLLLAVAMIAWQLALAGWTGTEAANAARTAARVDGRISNSDTAIKDAKTQLTDHGFDNNGTSVQVDSGAATVSVDLPILLPWIHVPIHIVERATMPNTK